MVDVDKEGARRDAQHAGTDTTRPYSQHSENVVGLAAEKAFAALFRLDFKAEWKPQGDGGVDFIWRGWTVDVKGSTFLHRPYLLVEVNKQNNASRHADVFVLGAVDMQRRVSRCLGWEFFEVIRTYPQGTMPGRDILNYKVPCDDLLPMRSMYEHIDWLAEYGGITKGQTQ